MPRGAAAGLASGETADGAGPDKVACTPAVSSLREVSCETRVTSVDVTVECPSASLACGSINHMAQPAMAMAGSTAHRASDLLNDHPAILIAVPSPGSTGDCRAAHEKAIRAFPVRLLSRPPLYGSRRSTTITQSRNGFVPPRQYCGGRAWLAG